MLKTELISWLDSKAHSRTKSVVLGHNLHSAYLYHSEFDFAKLYDMADVILPDGAPICLDANFSSALKGESKKSVRLGSTDWLPSFLQLATNHKIAVIGSTSFSNRKFLEAQLTHIHQNQVLGIPGENWNRDLEDHVVRCLNEFQPNLVILGLGMPLQERFILNRFDSLPNSVFVLVGGAIDQLSGGQSNAPRWLGRIGFEWAWRLVTQPKRLSKRYLIEPWKLLGIRIKQIFSENS
jgi:N-acetylglucosaminyldiphosphoundecaprenol N-acetyl-beta-D-mannosaminyltransferase